MFVNVAKKSAQHAHAGMIATVAEKVVRIYYIYIYQTILLITLYCKLAYEIEYGDNSTVVFIPIDYLR